MNFENNSGVKHEEKEVITELAEEGMAKAERMEGDKLDANVEAAKEGDKIVAHENLSQVREGMKQEIAQARAEDGEKSPEAIHTPEDMAAVAVMFEDIKEYLDKQADGKGILNRLAYGSAEAKAKLIANALKELENIKDLTLSGKNPNINVGLMLQQRDVERFASKVLNKHSETLAKFCPKDNGKNMTYTTHIFGSGQ